MFVFLSNRSRWRNRGTWSETVQKFWQAKEWKKPGTGDLTRPPVSPDTSRVRQKENESQNSSLTRNRRTLHRRCRNVRLDSKEEVPSDHSDSEKETMAEIPPIPPLIHPKRLLGDYGGTNAPGGRLTIVIQPVNVTNFQLHSSTINQLERKSFIGKVNEDANKHLQRFLTMSTTLKIDGHTDVAKKLRMFSFT
ncbi:hypothetical protein KIW84_042755 [Lathyrus oleraceus]|uniref:Uncharacterized protein n=1 Tax=Pisum sativum TaxID=3888 RepID=A0A9D4XDJ1_PEA|nr:hypothetical protein KIW84_042755 [Pisum sativum]